MRNDGLKIGKDGSVSSQPIEELIGKGTPVKMPNASPPKITTVSPYRLMALKKLMR